MEKIITIEEFEQKFGIKLPKKYHEIYNTGAMEWLKYDYEWLKAHYEEVKSNPQSFFFTVLGDCEPLPFSEVRNSIDYMLDILSWDDDFKSGKVTLNPKYRFIPFAQTGGGDVYCFMYEDVKAEPKIIIFDHESVELRLWAKDFDKFLYRSLLESIVHYDVEFATPCIIEHIKFLKAEYKKVFEDKDIDTMKATLQKFSVIETVEFLVKNKGN